MGALVALLPAMGAAAGGAATTAGTMGAVMTGLSAVSGLAGMVSTIQQGGAAADSAEYQSRQLALQGRLDAITTNEELLKTLSTNRVAAIAGGLESAGSVEYAKQESMRNAAEQLSLNRDNIKMKQQQVEAAGRAAKTQSIFDAVGQGISVGDIVGSALQTKKSTTG
jgi:hypothetical protein